MLRSSDDFCIDPHQYFGVVLDLDEEDIPVHLASHLGRYGAMDLWRYQAALHHEHVDPTAEPEEILPDEVRQMAAWATILRERFPKFRFVVETNTLRDMTWFQATETAPTEDSGAWMLYRPCVAPERLPRSHFDSPQSWLQYVHESRRRAEEASTREGADGPCEKCLARDGFTEPQLCSFHRGAQTMVCKSCGATVVYSTRTIRDRVGSWA